MAESAQDKDVLILAPHPDDESFGCGGTICMIVESGVPVDVVFMTRGELGHEEGPGISQEKQQQLAQTRANEAAAACSVLGVRRQSYLNGRDSYLNEDIHLVGALVNVLNNNPYRRIFCPWRHDAHTDHIATFSLLKMALKKISHDYQIWLYEVWKPLEANMLIPIDNTVERKRSAIMKYSSQLPQVNYHEGFLGLSAYRSVFCPPSRFAEAFFVCTKQEMLRM